MCGSQVRACETSYARTAADFQRALVPSLGSACRCTSSLPAEVSTQSRWAPEADVQRSAHLTACALRFDCHRTRHRGRSATATVAYGFTRRRRQSSPRATASGPPLGIPTRRTKRNEILDHAGPPCLARASLHRTCARGRSSGSSAPLANAPQPAQRHPHPPSPRPRPAHAHGRRGINGLPPTAQGPISWGPVHGTRRPSPAGPSTAATHTPGPTLMRKPCHAAACSHSIIM